MMTPRHRLEPVKTGGAVRRAVVTSVLSAVVLASVTITAAAVTLTGGEPKAGAAEQSTPPTSATSSASSASPSTLAPPVDVEDAPIGIPRVALIDTDGPVLADIPATALAAYQRAEAVLQGADKACHLSWTLLAAIGQVVTQHGTQDGASLDRKGVVRPHLKGAPIKGKDGKRLPDSDAGAVDGDKRYDRPVGPLQLAAPTWAVVGVDGDGDGRRNPYDIDDAALAVGVLVCSGGEDLRKRTGRVGAVMRVNADRSFVETVLAIARSYRDQMAEALAADPTVVPPETSDLPSTIPAKTAVTPSEHPTRPSDAPGSDGTGGPTWTPSDTPSSTPSETPTGTPTETPSDTASSSPSSSPSDRPSESSSTGSSESASGSSSPDGS